MEPLLNIEAAGRLLGLSPWTIRMKIRQKELLPVKLGRRVLLEPREIERYVARCKGTVAGSTSNEIPANREGTRTVEDSVQPMVDSDCDQQAITSMEKGVSQ